MGCNSSLLSLSQKQSSERNSIDFSVFVKANTTQVLQTYKFCSWISRSPTAMVRKVIQKNSGIERVVKIYHRQRDNQQKAMNEINALKKLDHPNIIRLYQYFLDQSFIYIILQKIQGKQLLGQILNSDQSVQKNFPNIFKQILIAIEHCHSHGIIHRNITSDNILVQKASDSKYIVKLIDFSQVYFMPKSKLQNREKQKFLLMKKKVVVQDYWSQQQTFKINVISQKRQNYHIKDEIQKYFASTEKKNETQVYNHQSQQIKSNEKLNEPPEVRIKSSQVSSINKRKNGKQKRILNSQLYHQNNETGKKLKQQINFKTMPFSDNHRKLHNYSQQKQKYFNSKNSQNFFEQLIQNLLPDQAADMYKSTKFLQAKENLQFSQTNKNNQIYLNYIQNNDQSQNNSSNLIKLKCNQSNKNIRDNEQRNALKINNNLNVSPNKKKKISSLSQKPYIRDNPKQEIYLRSQLNKLKIPIHRKINPAFDPPQEPSMDTIEKEDIWFAGIILFTLVTGKNLLAEAKPAKQIINKLIHSWIRENPDASQIGDLMMQMLTISPQTRLHAYECLDHKFLKQNTQNGTQWKLTMVYKFLHDYKLQHNVKSLFAMYLTRQISTVYDQTQFMLEFSNLDLNNDGKLQYDQLIQGLINSFTIDKQSAVKYVQQIFSSLDKNNNRCIQYSEFLMGTMNMTKKIKDDNIRKLFYQMDRNRDGYISEEELKFLFEGFQNDKQFKKLMQLRKSSTKGVNIDEFTQFIKKILDPGYTT